MSDNTQTPKRVQGLSMPAQPTSPASPSPSATTAGR